MNSLSTQFWRTDHFQFILTLTAVTLSALILISAFYSKGNIKLNQLTRITQPKIKNFLKASSIGQKLRRQKFHVVWIFSLSRLQVNRVSPSGRRAESSRPPRPIPTPELNCTRKNQLLGSSTTTYRRKTTTANSSAAPSPAFCSSK